MSKGRLSLLERLVTLKTASKMHVAPRIFSSTFIEFPAFFVFICVHLLSDASYTYICFHLLSSAFIHFHSPSWDEPMNTSLLRASLYDANNARYLQIYGKILFECLNLPLRSYVRGKHSRGKRESGGSFALLPPVETWATPHLPKKKPVETWTIPKKEKSKENQWRPEKSQDCSRTHFYFVPQILTVD